MEHSAAPSRDPSPGCRRLLGARILLAEDDALIAEVLKDQLLDLGCVVLGPASSVNEGLDLARGCQADLALLDVALADGSAEPLARALAKLGVPFALLTGASADELPEGLRNRPMVTKPFGLEAVVLALEKLLHGPRV